MATGGSWLRVKERGGQPLSLEHPTGRSPGSWPPWKDRGSLNQCLCRFADWWHLGIALISVSLLDSWCPKQSFYDPFPLQHCCSSAQSPLLYWEGPDSPLSLCETGQNPFGYTSLPMVMLNLVCDCLFQGFQWTTEVRRALSASPVSPSCCLYHPSYLLVWAFSWDKGWPPWNLCCSFLVPQGPRCYQPSPSATQQAAAFAGLAGVGPWHASSSLLPLLKPWDLTSCGKPYHRKHDIRYENTSAKLRSRLCRAEAWRSGSHGVADTANAVPQRAGK